MSQLSLFRDVNATDESLFQTATKLKIQTQNEYIKFWSSQVSINELDILVVKLETTFEQIRDSTIATPDDPHLLTRRIKTVASDLSTGRILAETSKIIPKVANLMYAGGDRDLKSFLTKSMQMFAFTFAFNCFSNIDFVKQIEDLRKGRVLIISFNHSLDIRGASSADTLHSTVLSNGISNIYERLRKTALGKACVIVGAFRDFVLHSELIADLDTYHAASPKYSSLFSTDYLFLNNADFDFQKAYTASWPTIVCTPHILKGKQLTFEGLNYLYCKETLDSTFYRFDIDNVSAIGGDKFLSLAKSLQSQFKNFVS